MVVKIVLDQPGLFELLRSPTGAVARDALRRGDRVQAVARVLAPKRTGRLAASISVDLVAHRGGVAVQVGTNVDYALFQHDGTGIYGRGRPIRPRAGKVLVFVSGGVKVYAHQVRGAPATKFLERAIFAAI
jgi:bacteriophage HK97-gp10 putative tail-component